MRARILSGLLVALVSTSVTAAVPAGDFHDRLRIAVESGALDPATADLYRLYAVVAPERLPPEYRREEGHRRAASSVPGDAIIRCGTPILRAVESRLSDLREDLRAEARTLLTPERVALQTVTTGDKTVDTLLPNWIVTANFSFEWGPDLTNEDGSPPTDENDDGVPDVVELWARYFEASFSAVAEILNPADPGATFEGTALLTNRVPVYLGNSDPSRSIDNIGGLTYAFTQDGVPVPYIVVNNDLRFVPDNDEGQTLLGRIHGVMKITAAHEFFHVLHFLYEPAVWIPSRDDWWFETSSTWMEDEVFDGVNDYLQYFRDGSWTAMVEMGLPVLSTDPHYVTRAYGDVIFAKYLSEHVSGRASMGDIWDRIRFEGRRILYDNPAGTSVAGGALNSFAEARGFSGVGELYLGFAGANATMDYEEGEGFGTVPVRGGLDGTGPPVPAFLGSTYRRDSGGRGASVTLAGLPANAEWGLTLVGRPAPGAPPRVTGSLGIGEVLLSFGSYGELWAVPSYLEPAVPSASYQVSSTAEVPTDVTPPAVLPSLDALAVPGGIDVFWTPPAADDVAGHVITWSSPGISGSRTVVYPVSSAEVRELAPATYQVSVFAYDAVGNGGGARVATVTVTEASPVTPTPAVAILDRGENPLASDGGGGGGGGGCFLHALTAP